MLIDANLLIYATMSSYSQHHANRLWLDAQLGGDKSVGIPWESLNAFMRIVLNPRIFKRPMQASEAWAQVTDWLDCAPVWTPAAGPRHREIMSRLMLLKEIRANSIPDLHLAAIAIEHDLTLCSADVGFGKIAGLKWLNPIKV